MSTRRSPLGPWIKVYVSTLDTKAHYTDAQFRALVEVWMHAVRQPVRGLFANRSVIDRKVGAELAGFLFEQGDIELLANGSVSVHKWTDYQSGVLSTGRSRTNDDPEHVDNTSGTVPELLSYAPTRDARDAGLPSTTLETTEKNEGRVAGAGASFAADGDRDVLDAFYEITGSRPWGRPVATWLLELEATHGLVNVTAALTVEATNPDRKRLVERTAARLEAQAHRVASAKAKAPKPVDSLQAEMAAAVEARYGRQDDQTTPDATPDAIAAGRAAYEALRAQWGRPASRRNGGSARIGDVLSSMNGDRPGQPGLPDVGTASLTRPTREPGGDPSAPASAVRPASGRSPNEHGVPTDGAKEDR